MRTSKIVKEMARATGVAEADVSKVMNKLGLNRVHAQAIRGNGGKEPGLSSAKVAFKIGKSTVIV